MPQTPGAAGVPMPADDHTPRRRVSRAPLVLAAVLGSALSSTLVAAPADGVADEQTPRRSGADVPRHGVLQHGFDQHRAEQYRADVPRFAAAVTARTLAAPVRAAGPTYTVRSGDTISHIALRTGVSQATLLAANGLDRRGLIRAGQVLTIPSAGAGGSAPVPASAPTTSYTVQPGDTISHISLRTGVSQAALLAANGLDARGFIRAGQALTLPGSSAPAPSGGAPAAAPAGGPTTGYTVRGGDTLSGIAVTSRTTVAALRAANPGLDARGTIRVGQQLRVPAAPAPMPNTFAGRTYPAATVQAATANRDVLASRNVPSREQMRQIIAATAARHGVDPALAQAVAFQESGFNQRSVSPANAVGAMQVIPSSGRWASDMAGRQLDLLDPHDNATAGVLILKANAGAAGDLGTTIAAYYQGLTSVRKNGMYDDTRRYVANVQTLMNRYR